MINIGDLVRYGNDKDYGLGIVVKMVRQPNGHVVGVAVRWSNGVTSKHSARWIIRVKETA